MRRLQIAFPIAIAVLFASAIAVSEAQAATVRLGDNFFAPTSRTVSKGTKVRFNWTGNRRHNVTKRRGPGGGFRSTTTRRRGVNFSRRFNKAGVYRLVCTIHPEEMKLKLTAR